MGIKLAELLRSMRPSAQVEAGPIASSGRLQEVLRELAVAMDEAGLRELPHQEIAALGVTGAADHEEVMIQARRLAAARPELAERAGADEALLEELSRLGVALAQAEGAFRRLGAAAARGAAVVLADLTARVDLVDEAARQVAAQGRPAQRRMLEVVFEKEAQLRGKAEEAAQARRERAADRRALLQGRLSAERRRARALWVREQIRTARLPAPPEGGVR